MLSQTKQGDFKFMADKLFIIQQFTFLIIDSKSHGKNTRIRHRQNLQKGI
jgi:hypothetical protein